MRRRAALLVTGVALFLLAAGCRTPTGPGLHVTVRAEPTPSYGSRAAGGEVFGFGETVEASPSTAPTTEPRPLETGILSTTWTSSHAVIGRLGAKHTRVEFAVNTAPSAMRATIASLAAQGVRVLPLAGFPGRLPTEDEARNMRAWAAEFGPGGTFWANRSDGHLAIRDIEFGNETAYTYQYGDTQGSATYNQRARDYGRLAMVAIDALAGTGVGLMAQADPNGIWNAQMLGAVPDLGRRVSAWTVHPYGSYWKSSLEKLVASLAASGSPADTPIAITEWGLATDNGRCLDDNYKWNPCMTYDEAARVTRETLTGMRALLGSRLRTFIVYSWQDLNWSWNGVTTDREKFFGVTNVDQQDKGAYTGAIRDLLAGRLIG